MWPLIRRQINQLKISQKRHNALLDNYIEPAMLTAFHMLKEFVKDMKEIEKTQIKLPEMKTILSGEENGLY